MGRRKRVRTVLRAWVASLYCLCECIYARSAEDRSAGRGGARNQGREREKSYRVSGEKRLMGEAMGTRTRETEPDRWTWGPWMPAEFRNLTLLFSPPFSPCLCVCIYISMYICLSHSCRFPCRLR